MCRSPPGEGREQRVSLRSLSLRTSTPPLALSYIPPTTAHTLFPEHAHRKHLFLAALSHLAQGSQQAAGQNWMRMPTALSRFPRQITLPSVIGTRFATPLRHLHAVKIPSSGSPVTGHR